MSNELKNYIRYFFKSNRRLLLLEFIVLFVFIPFLAYSQIELGIGETQLRVTLLTLSSIMIIMSTLVLAFVMPIYTFRFIFKRVSSDLYFALPIKRGTLYTVQFMLGLLLAFIPLAINCLLVVLLICINVDVEVVSLLMFFLIDILVFVILYSLVSFLVVKCNNLLDAVLIAGAYMIMPIFVLLTFMTFLDGQGEQLFISQANIASELIGGVGLEFLMGMISLPATLAYAAIFLVQETPWITDCFMLFLMAYWMFVGILCFCFGKRTFIRRKEEEAQQRTTTIPTYPLIITLFIVCLMLLTFSYDIWSQSMMMTLIVLLLLYIVMQMFAKRSLRLHPKDFLLFVIILVSTYGFTLLFQSTGGFGLLHEVPNEEKVEYVEATYYDDNDSYYFRDVEGSIVYSNIADKEAITQLRKKDSIQKIMAIQNELIKSNKKNDGSSTVGYIQIYYHMENGNTISRMYDIYTSPSKDTNNMLKSRFEGQ